MQFLAKLKGPHFGNDFLASIVVFLVALPLCMGVAIASGAPPSAGLIAGVIGGLLVGFLSGSPLQASGPAAGLTVLVFDAVQRFGLRELGVMVVIAGLAQLAAGALRVGRYFRAVPPAVISGMLAGIGVLIFASQFHIMMDDSPKGSGINNLISIPDAVIKGLTPLEGTSHHYAAALGALTIVVIVLWTTFTPRRLKLVPAPLIAVVISALVAGLFALPVKYVDVPASLFANLQAPHVAGISFELVGEALALALIASAETLLTASAVDQMQSGPRTQYDRELIAQGAGNITSGLLGGLPITGVIVRSAANVEAGAKTRRSTMLHGLWLLAAVLLLSDLLRLIPVASLAAVLVFTGYKLAHPKNAKAAAKHGRGELFIFLATVVAIVTTDLLVGVLVGLGLALVKMIYSFSALSLHHSQEGETEILRAEGVASFLTLPRLLTAVEAIPPKQSALVDLSGLRYLDPSCTEALRAWETQYKVTGGAPSIRWPKAQATKKNAQNGSPAAVTD
jgi:MFS superfamily sulfate permease-like transporter